MLISQGMLHRFHVSNDAPMQVTTADIIPPNFTAGTPLVSKVDETDFTLLVQLDKPTCTVYFSVLLYTAAQPSFQGDHCHQWHGKS